MPSEAPAVAGASGGSANEILRLTPGEVFEQMCGEFAKAPGARGKPRRYVGGLLVSFCEFLKELGSPGAGFGSLEDLFGRYPQITEGVSALTVRLPGGGQKTIRPAYERAHRFFLFESKRLDYPRSQPYATGKWSDYRAWLDAMVSFSAPELEWVAESTRGFVLAQLPEHVFDPSSVRVEPPIFRMLLETFRFSERGVGEPAGAAFQAAIFGYLRADAPHLQVEARKVRAGSARTAGIGDIDAWEGDQLIISAEVKAFVVDDRIVEDLDYFISEVQKRGALGLLVAEDFKEGARAAIDPLGIVSVSRADLVRLVSLWDPLKQRAALNAFQFVVVHREQSRPLISRVQEFLEMVGYRRVAPPVPAPIPDRVVRAIATPLPGRPPTDQYFR